MLTTKSRIIIIQVKNKCIININFKFSERHDILLNIYFHFLYTQQKYFMVIN